jgi:radical SAM superfamily enzyme YgiQ (UPF0313 family)
MRVLFIYPDYAVSMSRCFQRGVAYLSSALKKDGVETGLIHIYTKPDKENFLKRIRDFNPDILAYSSISNHYPLVKKLAGWSKGLGIYTVFGGIHPTIESENSINTPGIDAICIGEGERAFPEFVSVFREGGDITKIQNFWVRKDGVVHKNPVRPLIENLDELIFPDYDLFPYNEIDDFAAFKIISVQATRGCPYKCTYCCNHYLKTLYPNPNKYLRFRSVDNVLSEIKLLKEKYPKAKVVRFNDDTLSTNKKWFEEFTSKYKEQIGLPYTTNDHPHNISAEKAMLYRKSGCVSIEMGIENGNFEIRKNIMKRPFPNEEVINAFDQMEKVGINTSAFNIFGIPDETMSTMLDTVKLNAQCRPGAYIKAYFQPFFKTEAYEICKERGYKIHDLKSTLFEEPILELDTATRAEIMFGFKYFGVLVRLYRFLFSISKNENAALVKFVDSILTSRLMPYALLNKIMITRVDIKTKMPGTAIVLTKIKRLLFNRNVQQVRDV